MAEAKRVPVSYKAIKWLIWKLSPKMRVDGLENLPEGGAVIVGNHAHMYGPIAAELYIKDNHHIWCAAQMMDVPVTERLPHGTGLLFHFVAEL